MRNPAFGRAVEKLVKERGNRLRVAAALDVSEKTIYRWQNRGLGEHTARHFRAIIELARLAECPLEEMLK